MVYSFYAHPSLGKVYEDVMPYPELPIYCNISYSSLICSSLFYLRLFYSVLFLYCVETFSELLMVRNIGTLVRAIENARLGHQQKDSLIAA